MLPRPPVPAWLASALALALLGCPGSGGGPDAGGDPADTEILSGPGGLVATASARFTFGSIPPGAAFECSLDGAPWSACSSPKDYAALPDGARAFAVRAVNAGGADPTPATWAWTIDTQAPGVTISSGPDALTSSSSAAFVFAVDDSASVSCTLDAQAPEPCASPYPLADLGDGSHILVVTATDSAGNAGSASWSWSVDSTAPVITITSGPSGAVASASASFVFTVDEPATRTCALDAQAPVACISPYAVASLAEGAHTLVISATDAVGNFSSATRTWTVDTRAPVVTIDSAPEGWGADTSATFVFSTDEPANTTCALDGQAAIPCASPAVESGLSDGVHTLVIRATDAAGNAGVAATSWGVDAAYSSAAYIRIAASNLTSGNFQRYEGPGTRILQGLMPDIVLLQEFRVSSTNTDAEIQTWVTDTFGVGFTYYREVSGNAVNIPNGIVSRYPIVATGRFLDPIPTITDRGFAWARIDLPGPLDLWAMSLHLYASGTATDRNTEAQSVVADLQSLSIPPADFLVVGGDLNTGSRGESGLTTLGQLVSTSAPYPADQAGNAMTNSGRTKPYDWVMVDPELELVEVPVLVGRQAYPDGLVFDSRVYTPLSDAPGVLQADSGETGMQHMLVIKDFRVSL